jgi:hypothetical protein
MAHEHNGPVELIDHRPHVRGVVGKPAQRVWRRKNRLTIASEVIVHTPPGRRICKRAVNEDNGWTCHVEAFHLDG